MKTVIVHKYAGILSAFGMALADVVHEEQVPAALVFSSPAMPRINATVTELGEKCIVKLKAQGFTDQQISLDCWF